MVLATALILVGASGTTRGIAASEFGEKPPVPAAFFAATLKVNGEPVARPVTVMVSLVEAVCVKSVHTFDAVHDCTT